MHFESVKYIMYIVTSPNYSASCEVVDILFKLLLQVFNSINSLLRTFLTLLKPLIEMINFIQQ